MLPFSAPRLAAPDSFGQRGQPISANLPAAPRAVISSGHCPLPKGTSGKRTQREKARELEGKAHEGVLEGLGKHTAPPQAPRRALLLHTLTTSTAPSPSTLRPLSPHTSNRRHGQQPGKPAWACGVSEGMKTALLGGAALAR